MIYFFTYAHIAEELHCSKSFSTICESCSASNGALEVFIVTLPSSFIYKAVLSLDKAIKKGLVNN